jgi:hypothetical protein
LFVITYALVLWINLHFVAESLRIVIIKWR